MYRLYSVLVHTQIGLTLYKNSICKSNPESKNSKAGISWRNAADSHR